MSPYLSSPFSRHSSADGMGPSEHRMSAWCVGVYRTGTVGMNTFNNKERQAGVTWLRIWVKGYQEMSMVEWGDD
jgi:hypothetical protein